MIQLFRKILCSIDFSEHSLAALEVALKVVQQNDAKLYLLSVAPDSATFDLPSICSTPNLNNQGGNDNGQGNEVGLCTPTIPGICL